MTANIKFLPVYTKKEEVSNSVSHFVGALFGIATLITFIVLGILKGYDFVHMIPFYTYSLFMTAMFFISGLYHSRPFNSRSRAISRMIDHCDIYAFVAATYFPICIYGITVPLYCYLILGLEVGLGLLGIIIHLIPSDSRLNKISTFIIYIIQGWLIIFFYPFNIGLPFTSFLFILLGGIIYSVGSILYAIGHYKRWQHTVFHIFVLIAAVLQFIGILFLL